VSVSVHQPRTRPVAHVLAVSPIDRREPGPISAGRIAARAARVRFNCGCRRRRGRGGMMSFNSCTFQSTKGAEVYCFSWLDGRRHTRSRISWALQRRRLRDRGLSGRVTVRPTAVAELATHTPASRTRVAGRSPNSSPCSQVTTPPRLRRHPPSQFFFARDPLTGPMR
jgi:hypothetical protein